ncbi:MAG: cytochrome c biogenesis protein CcdA, partial [Tepidisphaeraceae bacterium]
MLSLMRPTTLILAAAALALVASASRAAPPKPEPRAVLNYAALQPGQQAVVAVVVEVPDGFHAQSSEPLEKFLIPYTVTLEGTENAEVFAPQYPPAQIEEYAGLGKMSVYNGRIVTYVPVQVKAGAGPGSVSLAGWVRYQICDDQMCFPPRKAPFTLQTRIVPAGQPVVTNEPELFAGFDPRVWSQLAPAASASDASAALSAPKRATLFGFDLTDDGYGLAFAGAFVIGIIFNVVPCVLPVLPIKALSFYEVARHNRRKSVQLGAVFGAGIVATFGALALPVLVFKSLQWGELFGNPVFAGAVTLVLVVMALGLFGVFGVGLPQAFYRFTPRHDTYTGNFLFGILTAVLSTPCTFGLFFVLLLWAAKQHATVGVAMLMTVGAGMAFPYIVLSAFPELARRFPRTGPWPEVVKQMTAFLLLATAVYFGQVLLPASWRGPNLWWVLFALVAVAGLFLIVRAIQIAPRVLPVLVASVIALALVGPALAVTIKLANPPVEWVYFDADSFARARASGKPVVVKFTATWCLNCHTVEATVFGDPRTQDVVRDRGVVAIKADLTDQSAPGWD